MTLSAPSVGPDHITQRCAMYLQKEEKRTTSAFTMAAKATHQEGVQADQMITGRNQGQHQGTSRITEQAIQVVKTVFNQKRDSHHQTRLDKRFNR